MREQQSVRAKLSKGRKRCRTRAVSRYARILETLDFLVSLEGTDALACEQLSVRAKSSKRRRRCRPRAAARPRETVEEAQTLLHGSGEASARSRPRGGGAAAFEQQSVRAKPSKATPVLLHASSRAIARSRIAERLLEPTSPARTVAKAGPARTLL